MTAGQVAQDGEVVTVLGHRKQYANEDAWWKAWREDPPTRPVADYEVRDGRVYHWHRDGDVWKLWIGPWTLIRRPDPSARPHTVSQSIQDLLATRPWAPHQVEQNKAALRHLRALEFDYGGGAGRGQAEILADDGYWKHTGRT